MPQSPKAECRAAGDTQVISQNGIGVVLAKRHVLKFNVFIIGSPETRGFILVALARVNASNWFNIMTRLASFYRK